MIVTHLTTHTLKSARKGKTYEHSNGVGCAFASGNRFPPVLHSQHLCAAGKGRLEAQATNISCDRLNLACVNQRKCEDVAA